MGWFSCYELICKHKGDLSKITKEEKRYADNTNMPGDRKRAWEEAIGEYIKGGNVNLYNKPLSEVIADNQEEYNKMLKELHNK